MSIEEPLLDITTHILVGLYTYLQYVGRPCPPLHRTRGYMCSFPITWTPYLGYWLPIGTPPPKKKKEEEEEEEEAFPGVSREIFASSETTAKITPFPDKLWIRMRPPFAFECGGGGGGGE